MQTICVVQRQNRNRKSVKQIFCLKMNPRRGRKYEKQHFLISNWCCGWVILKWILDFLVCTEFYDIFLKLLLTSWILKLDAITPAKKFSLFLSKYWIWWKSIEAKYTLKSIKSNWEREMESKRIFSKTYFMGH